MPSYSHSPLTVALGGLFGIAAGMGIGRFVYTPILPEMMHDLALTAAQAGWIASANYVGYLVGAVGSAYGWAQGRERGLALAAVAASAMLAAVMALGDGVLFLMIIRGLAGVASAFVMVFLGAVVLSRLTAAGRFDLQTVHFAGMGVGIAGSALLTGALLGSGLSWRAAWLGVAVLAAVWCAVALWLVPPTPASGDRTVREPALPATRGMRMMILSYGLFGFGYIITMTFLVAIVRDGGGSLGFESGVWVVVGLAAIPSIWIWAMVGRRIGLARAYALALIVEALGVLASVTLGTPVGPLLAAALVGGTFMAATAVGLQLGRGIATHSPRRVFAMMTAAFGTGQILGPPVAGILADTTGSYTVSSTLSALVLIAAAALAWQSMPERREL